MLKQVQQSHDDYMHVWNMKEDKLTINNIYQVGAIVGILKAYATWINLLSVMTTQES